MINYNLTDKPCQVGNYKFYTFLNNWHCVSTHLRRGGWELEQQNLFLSYCHNDKYSIDVGGEIGSHSIPMADKSLKLLTFEPNKEHYKLLTKNIILNGLENKTKIYNCAVGDKVSKVNMTGAYSHIANETSNGDTTQVTLDHVLSSEGILPSQVSFIKIDVEGYEFFVLNGAINLLKNSKDLAIYLETHPGSVVDKDCKNKCENFLTNLNFTKIKEMSSDNALWVSRKS